MEGSHILQHYGSNVMIATVIVEAPARVCGRHIVDNSMTRSDESSIHFSLSLCVFHPDRVDLLVLTKESVPSTVGCRIRGGKRLCHFIQ